MNIEDIAAPPVQRNMRVISEQQMPRIPLESLGALAQDITMRTASLEEIAFTYNMSIHQLTYAVVHHTRLRDTIKSLYRELSINPSVSRYNLQVRGMTEAMFPTVLELVRDPATRGSDRAGLIKTFMTSVTNADKIKAMAQGGNNQQTAVAISFNTTAGIRGISDMKAKVVE